MNEASTASTRRHSEVGTVGALLLRPDGSLVTRTGFLIDGRVPAACLVRRTLRDARRGGNETMSCRHRQCGPGTLSP
jgi:hypothetical protein